MDFMGPLPTGDYLFAVVDYYSRFLEVEIMRQTTTEAVLKQLMVMFARHGYPATIMCDNGKQVMWDEFNVWMQTNGITVVHSAPIWPQANGEIERQNLNIIKRLKIAQAEGKDWKQELLNFLSTPHTSTGVSPAEMLFGRKLKTKLPELAETATLDEEIRERERGREK